MPSKHRSMPSKHRSHSFVAIISNSSGLRYARDFEATALGYKEVFYPPCQLALFSSCTFGISQGNVSTPMENPAHPRGEKVAESNMVSVREVHGGAALHRCRPRTRSRSQEVCGKRRRVDEGIIPEHSSASTIEVTFHPFVQHCLCFDDADCVCSRRNWSFETGSSRKKSIHYVRLKWQFRTTYTINCESMRL